MSGPTGPSCSPLLLLARDRVSLLCWYGCRKLFISLCKIKLALFNSCPHINRSRTKTVWRNQQK